MFLDQTDTNSKICSMIDAVIITIIKHRVLMDREVIKFNGLAIQTVRYVLW